MPPELLPVLVISTVIMVYSLYTLPCRLPDFYRSVIVYVPFVGTGIGLLTILALLLLEWRERRRANVHVHIQVSV